MPSAEIITIGTEILLGDIVDTNAPHIARFLRDLGIDLYRKTSVGDNAGRIAQMIREALGRAEIVITTGGLGPTVDDPTRDAVALAMGVETEFRPDLWEQIQARFRRFHREPTENNRRQAYVPRGAIAVENPVGTAPSFIVETDCCAIVALPGVPREMEYLLQHAVLPYLRRRFDLRGIIKTRMLHTAGAGESQIDDCIGDLERLSNPTVGLTAHSGQVDIRIAAKADSEAAADALIAPVEADLRQRLGGWIFGVDADTLQEASMGVLSSRGWKLAVVEAGLGGELVKFLARQPGFVGAETLADRPEIEQLAAITANYAHSRQAEVGLGVMLIPGPEKHEVHISLITPDGNQSLERPYGGPPENAPRWATNHALNLLRLLGA